MREILNFAGHAENPPGFNGGHLEGMSDEEFRKFSANGPLHCLIPNTHSFTKKEVVLVRSQGGQATYGRISNIVKKNQLFDLVVIDYLGD